MAFHPPEPSSKEEKQQIAEEAMAGSSKPKKGGRHPGKLHRIELEALDKGYKVTTHRRVPVSGKDAKGPDVYDGHQHVRNEAAFTNKSAAVSHVMEHLGTGGSVDPDNDAD